MYSLVASCNVTTFTKVDQVQEVVKIDTSSFNLDEIGKLFPSYLTQKV